MDTTTVLCFGDSNTHGTRPMRHMNDRRRFAWDERWPGVMAAALDAGWRVIEEGLPGRTTMHDDPIEGAHKNGRKALPMMLESHLPIDIVVLMLGTNDLKARFSLPAFDIAISIERLAEAIAVSGAGPGGAPPRLLIVSPPPVLEAGWLAPMFAGAAAKSKELAKLYAEAAERRAASFLDAGTVISSSAIDGVHFEADQHQKLGHAMAEAVRSL